jgi:hypothetical protein
LSVKKARRYYTVFLVNDKIKTRGTIFFLGISSLITDVAGVGIGRGGKNKTPDNARLSGVDSYSIFLTGPWADQAECRLKNAKNGAGNGT